MENKILLNLEKNNRWLIEELFLLKESYSFFHFRKRRYVNNLIKNIIFILRKKGPFSLEDRWLLDDAFALVDLEVLK